MATRAIADNVDLQTIVFAAIGYRRANVKPKIVSRRRPGRQGRPDRPGRPDRTGRPDRPGRPDIDQCGIQRQRSTPGGLIDWID